MPVLDRLRGAVPDRGDEPPKERPPQIFRGNSGIGSYSLPGLRERIELQLRLELGGREGLLLREADEVTRRALIREAGNYVLAVESLSLMPQERQALFDAVYDEVFGLGVLGALLADESLTEIVAHGPERLYIRRGAAELEAVGEVFADDAHLRRVVERLVSLAGGALSGDVPFLEVGLEVRGRPLRVSVMLPPLSPALQLEIRLRPVQVMTLDGLCAKGAVSPQGQVLLAALACAPYGVLITGEAASGKTALLEALLGALAQVEGGVLVERAAEIRAPDGMIALRAWPGMADTAAVSFADQIAAGLERQPGLLALDELRGDEGAALWQALDATALIRLLLVLRSSPDAARLRSAFGMALRKGRPAVAPEVIDGILLERLPFVVTMALTPDGPRVRGISEWRAGESGPALWPLLDVDGALVARPERALPLPEGWPRTGSG